MLKYIERTTAENVTNEDIHTIHEFVEKAKHRKEVGINYMKMWEEKQLIRKEALAEGRAEGIELGRAEGRELGRVEGRAEERSTGIKALVETCQEFKRTQEETLSVLLEKFDITKEEAQESIEAYWIK